VNGSVEPPITGRAPNVGQPLTGRRPNVGQAFTACHGPRPSVLVLLALSLVVPACNSRATVATEEAPRTLQQITLPDLVRVDAPVQAQLRDRYEAVSKLAASGTASDKDLGTAYGEYGMLMQAAEYHDAAACISMPYSP
jgi:hypothetical protein